MSFISDDIDVSDADLDGHDPFIEDIIRRTQSDTKRRLIFQPEETSSILQVYVFEKNKQQQSTDHNDEGTHHHHLNEEDDQESTSLVVMAMHSDDPYLDFRRSMEEILETQRLLEDDNNSQYWGRLEELLSWYLCVNGKSNHGYIVGAFVDLLMNKLSTTSSSNDD